MSDFDESEPSISLEAVERRAEARGLMRNLTLTTEGHPDAELTEASRKDFFASVDNPEAWQLGDVFEVTIKDGDALSFNCKVEVVRKSIEPKRGVAMRISYIAPAADEVLREILRGIVSDYTKEPGPVA